jgi:outer membrane usher protein FimD/PapC
MLIKNKVMKKLITVSLLLLNPLIALSEEAVDFNINILNAEDRENINLAVFSQDLYIVPGIYPFKLSINNAYIPEQKITVVSYEEKSQACLTDEIVEKFDLNSEAGSVLQWNTIDGLECLDIASLEGMSVTPNLSTGTLIINIPKSYQEYSANDWESASRWEDGIKGIIFDYNLTSQYNHSLGDNKSNNTFFLSGLGAVGANFDSWRLRGFWQGSYNHAQNSRVDDTHDIKWTNIYAYRAIRSLKSKLTLGEDFLQTDLFDSFKFIGISLRSDDNMLPPSLRSYAPEVTGFAETNAVVKISQDGRVIYESLVPAGPFRIQNLNSGISGTLQVRVEESDGRVSEFEVEAGNIPFLSRPGSVRYKVSAGRPTDMDRHVMGDAFAQSEVSWGVSNGWSVFGGALNSSRFNSFAAGVGRDLFQFGAISFSFNHSIAALTDGPTLKGKAFKVDYYKSFEGSNSQIQLSAYRFMDREFMTMSDFLTYNDQKDIMYAGHNKGSYSASLSKNFTDWRSSINLNYTHQTYWNRPNSYRYNMTFSKYFDTSKFHNIGLSINMFNSKMQGYQDNGVYVSLSVPLASGTYVNYSTYNGKNDNTNKVTVNERLENKDNLSLSIGNNRHSGIFSSYYSHKGNMNDFNTSYNYISNNSMSLSANVQGGITLTGYGIGMHPVTSTGGTRVFVDTNGVKDVPVKYNGTHLRSSGSGKVVVPDINSYYKTDVVVDINKLPKNVEVADSVTRTTLTEGAIGYRSFDVISGIKMMVMLRLQDGSYPPFAADIKNNAGKTTGIVGDQGEAYIGGIRPGEAMKVLWQGSECTITFPQNIEEHNIYDKLLLPCN